MRKENNKTNERRNGATEQYFCINYVGGACTLSLSLFLSFFLGDIIRTIYIYIRAFRDQSLQYICFSVTVTVIACSKQI